MLKLSKKISKAVFALLISLKNKISQLIQIIFFAIKGLAEKLFAKILRKDGLSFKTPIFATALIIIIGLLALITFRLVSGKIEDFNTKKMRMRPVSVVVKPVVLGDITVTQTALGTVIPRNVVTVRTQVDGVLSAVYFKEGQEVKSGQVLALIDPRPFAAAVKQAEGTIKRDKMLLENAQLDLKRYKSLLSQDSISSQVYDTQKALVQQYSGTVLTDEGLLDAAKLQLSYTKIIAPISGRIGLRQVDPGNVVHASDTNGLFVITQIKPITVVYSVPQDSLPSYTKIFQINGLNHPSPESSTTPSRKSKDQKEKVANELNEAKIDVEVWNSNNKIKLSSGSLDSIDNQIDLSTGTIKLKAIFTNEDNNLFPNQFVNVKTILETRKDVVIMPASAIQMGTPGTFVYRLNPEQKTVSVVPIKVGPQDNNMVQIESGLQPGDQVVVDGMDKLRNGARVEIGQAPDARKGSRKGAWADKNPQSTGSAVQDNQKIPEPSQPIIKKDPQNSAPSKDEASPKNGQDLNSDQAARREAWEKKKRAKKED